jgi:uncharacterized damage-inducible protein DinB
MPASDPLDILLAHDRWATRQILNVCGKLAPEHFHRRFEMGPGSLHDTVTHMLAAMRVWADLLAGREQRERLEGTNRSVEELRRLQDQIADDLEASARAHPLEGMVVRVRGGQSFPITRGAVLTHVATHGMHHRAQCLNMLRQLGVSPLPPSSVVEWTRMAEGGR